MKFGKRLAAEAARRWTEQYLDYKAVKKAIKDDIRRADASASGFLQVLQTELSKVSAFYLQQADALEARLNALTAGSSGGSGSAAAAACSAAANLSQVRAEVAALIKFVALNYLAVVKAVKKRNRHISVALGSSAGVRPLHPLDILSHEAFFTSNRLAALATRAEVLSHGSSSGSPADGTLAAATAAPRPAASSFGAAGTAGDAAAEREALLQDYQCPVCLDLLRNPVVLTCAHRFCWGCLVAHYAALRAPRPAAAAGGNSSSYARADAASGEALVVLEKLLEGQDESESCQAYACPVCRQPQMLNIESLTVDQHLAGFVDGLRTQLGRTVSSDSGAVAAASDDATMAEAAAEEEEEGADAASSPTAASEASAAPSEDMVIEVEASTASEEWEEPEPECGWLLPPQAPEHDGRLTVLLDLDGTLISSFTPKRAPRLPASMVTHTVGVGSALNPGGVFVVERPGLGAFLRELASFAEVAAFTAGLREYAEPIIDAIDPDRSVFADRRIYREGTVETEHYQCVKDMARVGRRAGRVVLLDDTPLAFLRQPANGIPVLGFRGDPDDRLLGEAVLPLLQNLAAVPDVRPRLIERFGMPRWFEQHNYPSSIWERRPAAKAAAKAPSAASLLSARRPRTAPIAAAGAPSAASPVPPQPAKEVLFLTDFDNTLTAWDAGERLVGELAPELAPMLAALKMPANFVPLTNQILGEMARRGLTRDALLSALQRMGAELPPATVRMLRAARARGVDVTILSDCNSTFISSVLAGARVRDCISDVITNGTSWERTGFGGAPAPALAALAPSQQQQQDNQQQQQSASAGALARAASYKLVIAPRRRVPGACPRCPSNLCKGEEVAALLQAGTYRRIVYAGDGANDICPALALRPCDVVLARRGHALADYAAASAAAAGNGNGVAKVAPGPAIGARVKTWETHEELAALVEKLTATTAGAAAAAAAMARLPN